MRFGSVCSGIESASVAWHPLGWQTAFVAEIEKFPSAVLAHHYPDVPNFGDITKFEDWPDVDIDLLVGGTPCQDFSVAGLRAGLDGKRGNLSLVYAAIARRYRPRWIVWENVPGVLSRNRGRDFASILGLLSGRRIETPPGGWQSAGVVPGIDRAYGLAWRVLDAQYFGLAQRRKRVFVVGYIGDWRAAAAVLLEREGLSGNPAPRRKAREDVAGTLAARAGGGGWPDGGDGRHSQLITAGTLRQHPRPGSNSIGAAIAFGGNNQSGPIDVATAQTAHGGTGRIDFESETFIAHSLRGEGHDASEDGSGRGVPLLPVVFDETQITSKECRSNPQPGDPCHTLSKGARPPTLAFSTKDYGNDCVEDVAPTMRAMGHSGSHQNAGGQLGVVSNWRVRRLTPTECERLMGFSDGYTAIPGVSSWPERVAREMAAYFGIPWLEITALRLAKDGPRYKALGNSKAVTVVRWLGRRIDLVDQIINRKEAA